MSTPPPSLSPLTTQTAEGLPRRRWSVAEIDRLIDLGFFGGKERPRERFELIGGEIVPMSSKGTSHEVVRRALQEFWFARTLSSDVSMVSETPLQQPPDIILEPDFFFWQTALPQSRIAFPTALFVVEVADTSLDYDSGPKAAFYAELGLREYWVIDATRQVTTIHRAPQGREFAQAVKHARTEIIAPELAPQLAVRLADLLKSAPFPA